MDKNNTSRTAARTGRPNRLIHEKSPYLLQHAYNPVDWYPWGQEAFNAAREADKPLFVSIGYSTCHWCHVMERESFDDDGIAAMLNDTFICIKVDREERPDIDQLYMSAVQAMTGSGGWPLTICMDCGKTPFFAATYLPPVTRHGIPGMKDLIPRIAMLWKTDRADMLRYGTAVLDTLSHDRQLEEANDPGSSLLDEAFGSLSRQYDPQYGGFGRAPKFPTPHMLIFLLRYGYRTGNADAFRMVQKTLDHMAAGGIHDQLGSGFHRYSTDSRWIVPHFEKMLYDQALIIMAYTEAYLATGSEHYRLVAMSTLEYVIREMTDPSGGFYSAEDADSEGEEGKYYLWTRNELEQLLDSGEQHAIFSLYRIQSEGNFIDPATGGKSGRNILYRTPASGSGTPHPRDDTDQALITQAREKMLRARNARVHPGIDDKILTDWNGLMIAALAVAARAFDAHPYLEAAERAAQFLLRHMRTPDGGLLHFSREGKASVPGLGQDYAFLIFGLVTLYQAGFKSEFLREAMDLERYFTAHFWDKDTGGYFNIPDTEKDLPVRMKDFYDGALPSYNSVACYLHIILGRITGDPQYEQKSASIARLLTRSARELPLGHTFFLTALDHAIGPSAELVLVGRVDEPGLIAMRTAVDQQYLPRLVVIFRPDNEELPDITLLAPYSAAMHRVDGQPAAYFCSGGTCHPPVTRVEDLEQWFNPGGRHD